MVTRSPTRTSRSSETDIEESIARREFVTFMTRPVTVLPRLALTRRRGRGGSRRTGPRSPAPGCRCSARSDRPRRRCGAPRGARRDDRPQRARVHLAGEQAGLAGGEPDRAPRGDRALPRAPELGGGDVDVADELRAVVVARATSAPEPTVTAFAAAFAAARSACAWVTPWAASCAPTSAAWRSASVASRAQLEPPRLRLARLLDGGVQRALLGGHVGVRLRLVALAVGGRDGRPDDAFAAAACAASSLACAVATRRFAVPTASRAVLTSMRACATSAGRTVRCACSTLLWAWSRASRACAAAASATCNWSSSCRSARTGPSPGGGRSSRPPPPWPRRSGRPPHRWRTRAVAAHARAGTRPAHGRRDRGRGASGCRRAARTPGGRRPPWRPTRRRAGARLRRAGDDVAARALLDPRRGQDDRLGRAVAHRATDDDLGRERTADDPDRDVRGLRRGGVGRDLGGRADLARADPAEDRDGDERGERQGDDRLRRAPAIAGQRLGSRGTEPQRRAAPVPRHARSRRPGVCRPTRVTPHMASF